MASKLSESGWKAQVQKNKLKDNGLQKALAVYQGLEDERHDDRLKAIGVISQLANALKRSKEIANNEDVTDYLAEVISAAESEKKEISKAKGDAEKAATAAAKAASVREREQEEEDDEEEAGGSNDEEEEEDETADSYEKLATALKSLRTAKKPYYFLACDAKPYGLVVSRKDIRKNGQAKKELSQVSGGSRRPPRFGECRYEAGKYIFEMQRPPAGLARILQKWIKDATGMGVKVMVGAESGDDEVEEQGTRTNPATATQNAEEGESPAQSETASSQVRAAASREATEAEPDEETLAASASAAGGAAASAQQTSGRRAQSPGLQRAPAEWHQTRDLIDGKLNELKGAIRQAFSGEGDDLMAAIEQGMNKLDGILSKLDKSLADSLEKARDAADAGARRTELNKAKTILTNYINYVKSEPLIDQVDTNPFGVKTDIKKTLVEKLRLMAQAIG